MRFWLREIFGWLFVLLGLLLFYVSLGMITNTPPKYVQAPIPLAMGFIVFRGGIHLLKIAVAARMCSYAQTEMKKQDVRRPIGSPADAVGQDW